MKTRWTNREIEYLKEKYDRNSVLTCSKFLNRTPGSVKKKARRLGLSEKREPLTAEQVEQIKLHYSTNGPIALATKFKVDRDKVFHMAQKLGLKVTTETKGKISTRNNSGRKMSAKTRKKIGDANRKYTEPKCCVECGAEIMRKAKRCQPCELKRRSGEGHNWWNGGVTPLYGATFKRLYPIWKFPIMARDNYECQDCGKAHCNLEVHHVRLFTEIRDKVLKANPHLSIKRDKHKLAELIVNEHCLEDGITLCRECHEKRHWIKQGEVLEPPNASGEDNQQPSRLNVVNMVNRKVQRLMGEESQANKPDTSALHIIAKI